MEIINGWVKRESSFRGKTKAHCQEATGIGCNCLSESECKALKGCPSKSKIETEFLSFMEFFPGNGQVVDPAIGGYVLVHSRNFQKFRYKIVAHSVK
jgi:hypothetical protein